MRLRHGCFGAVEDIVDELRMISRLDVPTIKVVCVFVVYQEEVTTSSASEKIEVFTYLDITVGAENGQATVAPST